MVSAITVIIAYHLRETLVIWRVHLQEVAFVLNLLYVSHPFLLMPLGGPSQSV